MRLCLLAGTLRLVFVLHTWAPGQPSPLRTGTGGTEVLSPEVPPARGPVTPDLVCPPPCSAEADLGVSTAQGGCSAPTSKDAAGWSCGLVHPAGGQSPSPIWLMTSTHPVLWPRLSLSQAESFLTDFLCSASLNFHLNITHPIRINMIFHRKELYTGLCPRLKALFFPTFHRAPQALGQWGE